MTLIFENSEEESEYFGSSRIESVWEMEEKYNRKMYQGQIESITVEASKGEPVELFADGMTVDEMNLQTSISECDDVIGVLSQKEVVNFTKENSLVVGYKNE